MCLHLPPVSDYVTRHMDSVMATHPACFMATHPACALDTTHAPGPGSRWSCCSPSASPQTSGRQRFTQPTWSLILVAVSASRSTAPLSCRLCLQQPTSVPLVASGSKHSCAWCTTPAPNEATHNMLPITHNTTCTAHIPDGPANPPGECGRLVDVAARRPPRSAGAPPQLGTPPEQRHVCHGPPGRHQQQWQPCAAGPGWRLLGSCWG